MGQPSPSLNTATDLARQLWARVADDSAGAEEIAAAAESMGVQLRAGLGRWIGADGYQVLLDRALTLARAGHPALAGLSPMAGDQRATAAAVRTHGAAAVAAGLVAVVAALVELLGRIIGEEMSLRLVEQIGLPSPRAVTEFKSKRVRDG